MLTPDFRGVPDALDVVLGAAPGGLLAQHGDGAAPLPPGPPGQPLRPQPGAARRRRRAAATRGEYAGRVKTGIMLGLGETPDEMRATMRDIRGAGVEILTIGQYLQPTPKHLPVDRWVHPDEFAAYRDYALSLGFAHCEAGPLVRSSYHAHEHVKKEPGDVRDHRDSRDTERFVSLPSLLSLSLPGSGQIPSIRNRLTPSMKDSHNGSHFYFTMYSSARRHAALGRVFLRLLAGAALSLLAAAPALAAPAGISEVPGSPEGRPAFRFFGSEQGLPQITPQAFAVDARGFLWTGTGDGAAVYNGRTWKAVDMPNREESNTIKRHPGQRGRLDLVCDDHRPRPSPGWPMDPARRERRPALQPDPLSGRGEGRLPERALGGNGQGARAVGRLGLERVRRPRRPAFRTNGSRPSSLSRRSRARSSGSGPTSGSHAGREAAGRHFPPAADSRRRESRLWSRGTPAGAPSCGSRRTAAVSRGTTERNGRRRRGSPATVCSASPSWTAEPGTSSGWAPPRVWPAGPAATWTVYNSRNAGLPSEQIMRLFASRSGGRPVLWIGMNAGGMAVLHPGGWKALDFRNSGLPQAWIYHIAESGPPERPTYWFSTETAGLVRWEAGTWSVFRAGTPLENLEVNLALPTPGPHGSALWVGTNRGLWRWERGRWTSIRELASGFPEDANVLAMVESRTPSGPVLWVGTTLRPGALRRGPMPSPQSREFRSAGPPDLHPPGDPGG